MVYSSMDSLKADFDPGPKGEKPLWPLSNYGPNKFEPNLFPPMDESTEEMRVKYLLAQRNNTLNEYVRGIISTIVSLVYMRVPIFGWV